MNKKYIWVPIILFLIIVFLAVGVSTEFKFEIKKPYEFIRDFFDRWSSALTAAGTMILAVGVYITWYKNSNEKRENVRQQRLDQIL